MMKDANYTVFDKSENRIGLVKANNAKMALETAKEKYSDAFSVSRVTAWQVKRSKQSYM